MGVLAGLIYVYVAILVADALLSWFPGQSPQLRQAKRIARTLTDPVLAPVRRVVPPAGGLDFSVMIVVFILLAVARAL